MELSIGTKSVTLNNLERRDGFILHYFAELGSFQRQVLKSGRRTLIYSTSEM